MFEDVYKKINEIDTQRKKLNEELFVLIKQQICSTLDKYPEFIGIRWIQYIPSFNDGDPCTFTMDDPGYIVKKDNESNYSSFDTVIEIGKEEYSVVTKWEFNCEWDNETNKRIYTNTIDEDKVKLLSVIYSALQTVEEECQKQFGDNAEVIILRDRVIVNDYDCGY
jgi:hypothetical protein